MAHLVGFLRLKKNQRLNKLWFSFGWLLLLSTCLTALTADEDPVRSLPTAATSCLCSIDHYGGLLYSVNSHVEEANVSRHA